MTTEPASPRTVSRAEAVSSTLVARGDLAQAAERQAVEKAGQLGEACRAGTSSTNRVGDSEKSRTKSAAGVVRAGDIAQRHVRAQAAGQGHLRQRDGQPPFAQVVTAPDQPATDRLDGGP